MNKTWLLAVLCIGIALALGYGCMAPDTIDYVAPTPKSETQRVVINHELEAPEHTLEVSGYGEVITQPDFSTIALSVHAGADAAEAASTQCSELMQSTYDLAISLGVRQADITTSAIEIIPQVNESTGEAKGYTAAQNITMIVRDVALANSILSTIVDSSQTEILSVTYSLTDATSAYLEALAVAMADAQVKAQALAEASALTLGPVIYVSELNGEDALSAGTYPSSAIAIPARVNVTYKLP